MKRMNSKGFVTLAIMLATAVAGQAQAHDQVATRDQAVDERQGSGIGEIVVTAGKRSTNVQDVPMAITAIVAAFAVSTTIVDASPFSTNGALSLPTPLWTGARHYCANCSSSAVTAAVGHLAA